MNQIINLDSADLWLKILRYAESRADKHVYKNMFYVFGFQVFPDNDIFEFNNYSGTEMHELYAVWDKLPYQPMYKTL